MNLLKFAKFCIFLCLIVSTSADDKNTKPKPKVKIEVLKEVEPCNHRSKYQDLVRAHVVGYFEDGKQFDSTIERNEPLMIQLGSGQVIKGLDQGLLNMCAGEKRKLTIPPRYAYGSKDMMAPNGKMIPGGSTIIFEAELISAQPSPGTSEIFDKLDINKNGHIEMEELYEHLDFMSRSNNFPINLDEEGMRHMVEGIFSMADKDRDGGLSEKEFTGSALGKMGKKAKKDQPRGPKTDL